MAKKVTPELISQMISLYSELKTYSAVAKKLGVSAATVSKYLKDAFSEKTYTSYSGPEPCEFPDKNKVFGFGFLSNEERESYKAFVKEFN